MNTSIVLTVIAKDQPGIIRTVSSALKNHGGNWTQSSMSSLAGQFAGILLASVPSKNTVACLEELRQLESRGLHVVVEVSEEEPRQEPAEEFLLELVGNDHPGIVHDITSILAGYDVNVHDLETSVESASMGGGEVFRASAQLKVPAGTDIGKLAAELEDLANDLMVDIDLKC